jgi:uncharacterized protein YndB with AHSA1/START domain
MLNQMVKYHKISRDERSLKMKPITQTYKMKATPAEVFEALTNPAIIQKWSGAPATMNSQVGTEFSLFDGNIHGTNLEVVPNQKLVQGWYAGEWEKPSKVTFTLVPVEEETKVELLHEDVPVDEIKKISEGWSGFYLGQMQKMFAKEL